MEKSSKKDSRIAEILKVVKAIRKKRRLIRRKKAVKVEPQFPTIQFEPQNAVTREGQTIKRIDPPIMQPANTLLSYEQNAIKSQLSGILKYGQQNPIVNSGFTQQQYKTAEAQVFGEGRSFASNYNYFSTLGFNDQQATLLAKAVQKEIRSTGKEPSKVRVELTPRRPTQQDALFKDSPEQQTEVFGTPAYIKTGEGEIKSGYGVVNTGIPAEVEFNRDEGKEGIPLFFPENPDGPGETEQEILNTPYDRRLDSLDATQLSTEDLMDRINARMERLQGMLNVADRMDQDITAKILASEPVV
jgi:hypothetical protein